MNKLWDVSDKSLQDQAKKIVDIMLGSEDCPDLVRCRLNLDLSESPKLIQSNFIVIEAAMKNFEELIFDKKLSSNLYWIEIDVLKSEDYESLDEQFGMAGIVMILNNAQGRTMRSPTNPHMHYSTNEEMLEENEAIDRYDALAASCHQTSGRSQNAPRRLALLQRVKQPPDKPRRDQSRDFQDDTFDREDFCLVHELTWKDVVTV